MELVTLVVAQVATLLGVGLGGLLSWRAQASVLRRVHQQQWREAQRVAYTDFLSAVRRYIAYIQSPDANLVLQDSEERENPLAVFAGEGVKYKEAMDGTYAALVLLSGIGETQERAYELIRAAARAAGARAVPGTSRVPSARVAVVQEAQHRFVEAARRDLGAGVLDRRS